MESPNPLDAVAHLPFSEQVDALLVRFSLHGTEPQLIVFRLALRLVRARHAAPTLTDVAQASDRITTRLHGLLAQLDVISQINGVGGGRLLLPFPPGPGAWADPMQNALYAAAQRADDPACLELLRALSLDDLTGHLAPDMQADILQLARTIISATPELTTSHCH